MLITTNCAFGFIVRCKTVGIGRFGCYCSCIENGRSILKNCTWKSGISTEMRSRGQLKNTRKRKQNQFLLLPNFKLGN